MAAREFEVFLRNDCPFEFVKVEDKLEHDGEWLGGDASKPPDIIGARGAADSTGAWQSASGGLWRGAEGWASYRLQDKDMLFGSDKHGGVGPCVVIHWNNPYIWDPFGGTTPFEWWVGGCPGAEELGMTKEKLEGAAKDYALYVGLDHISSGASGDEEFSVELPQALSGLAGPGWWFAAFAGQHRIHMRCVLRPKGSVKSALGKELEGFEAKLPEPASTKLVPLVGAPSAAWNGTWVDSSPNAKIRVDIQGTATMHSVDVFEHLRPDDDASILQRVNLQASPESAAPYREDVWKAVTSAEGFQVVPKDALGLGEVATEIAGPGTVGLTTIDKGALGTGIGTAVETTTGSGVKATGVRVDTLAVVPNLDLELYGERGTDKVLRGFRLRYHRMGTSGTLLDVMLRPHTVIK